jgi:hypothetical protein
MDEWSKERERERNRKSRREHILTMSSPPAYPPQPCSCIVSPRTDRNSLKSGLGISASVTQQQSTNRTDQNNFRVLTVVPEFHGGGLPVLGIDHTHGQRCNPLQTMRKVRGDVYCIQDVKKKKKTKQRGTCEWIVLLPFQQIAPQLGLVLDGPPDAFRKYFVGEPVDDFLIVPSSGTRSSTERPTETTIRATERKKKSKI